jgi:hypothetical protein
MTKMKLTQKVVDGVGLDPTASSGTTRRLGSAFGCSLAGNRGIIRYRVAGVQRQKSLPGGLRLAKARAEAAEIRTSATRGVDRIAEGRAAAEAARQEAEAAKARSLGTLI